jgi:hypothetical protein
MHYIDLKEINSKTRKGRLFGMLIVFIFVLIVMLILMNVHSSQTVLNNLNLGQII